MFVECIELLPSSKVYTSKVQIDSFRLLARRLDFYLTQYFEVECVWLITAPEGKVVHAQVSKLHLPTCQTLASDYSFDFVVRDGLSKRNVVLFRSFNPYSSWWTSSGRRVSVMARIEKHFSSTIQKGNKYFYQDLLHHCATFLSLKYSDKIKGNATLFFPLCLSYI